MLVLNFIFRHTEQDDLVVSEEKRIIKHLLDKYSRVGQIGRPVYNASGKQNKSTKNVESNMDIPVKWAEEIKKHQKAWKELLFHIVVNNCRKINHKFVKDG